MSEDILPYLIGNSVMSRIVTLPDGTRLWVHMEATRVLAALISAVPKESLPSLLSATRALCDAILATQHTSMHIEMSKSLLRLIEECPSTPLPSMANGALLRPLNWMIQQNERRMIESSVGALIIGSKQFFADQNDQNAKQSLLLALRLQRYIGESHSEALLERASEILSVISPSFPEAADVLSFLQAAVAKESPEEPSGMWFCPFL